MGARLGLSQNRVSHLEGHADERSVKQLLVWCAVIGLELSLAARPATAQESGGTQVQRSPPAPVPAW